MESKVYNLLEELIERQQDLNKRIRKLEKDAFNPDNRIILAELRAKYNELSRTINMIKHL